jgi:hypothetical protein
MTPYNDARPMQDVETQTIRQSQKSNSLFLILAIRQSRVDIRTSKDVLEMEHIWYS